MKTYKQKTIEIDGEKYTITKLNNRKLIKALQMIVTDDLTAKFKNQDNASAIKAILEVLPDVAGAIAYATNNDKITEEKIMDEFGLDDATEIIGAILEVNNYEQIRKFFLDLKGKGGAKKAS